MRSLEPRAPWKNFGMSYLLTDGCDLEGGGKEVVFQMEVPQHEAFVRTPVISRALRYAIVLEVFPVPLDSFVSYFRRYPHLVDGR